MSDTDSQDVAKSNIKENSILNTRFYTVVNNYIKENNSYNITYNRIIRLRLFILNDYIFKYCNTKFNQCS